MVGRLRLAALAALLALAAPAVAQDSGAIPEEAKSYFTNGVDLLNEKTPNYQDAFVQFKLAYEKSNKSWKVLGNLGLCALKLERDGEALAYYGDYLKRGGAAIDPQERAAIERDLLLLKGNLATVTLSGAGLTQVIDARQGSTVPAQVYKVEGSGLTLSIRAGTHTLSASGSGAAEKWEIVLSPGQTASHTFFQSSAPPKASAAPTVAATGTTTSAPAADKVKHGGSRTGAYVALGIGGAGLLAGAAFGLIAKSSESKANDQCRGDVCPERSRSDFDSAKSKALISTIGFGVGLVGLGVGGTLLVLSKGKSQEARVAPLPGGAALVWEGKL